MAFPCVTTESYHVHVQCTSLVPRHSVITERLGTRLTVYILVSVPDLNPPQHGLHLVSRV